MNDLVLSTSAISTYLRCGYKYLLSYAYRRKGSQNLPAAIGQAVHAGVEALHRGEAATDVDQRVPAQEALYAAWDTETALVPTTDLDADPDALPDALKMLGVYRREVLPTFHPTLIEAPFTVMVEEVVLSGIIDSADDDLHDLKTTAGKTINGRKPHFDPANYDLQLSLYDLGYQGLTGRRPKRLILDVLTRRGTYRQYVRAPQIGEAVDALRVVRDGILREEFDPTGALNGSCRWCEFATKGCSYAVTE